MPYYVHLTRIDWHYEQASAELQPVLQRANLDLMSRDHTADTFVAGFRKVAAERTDVVAEALVLDGFRTYRLFRARDGKVEELPVDERPEGATAPVALPLDEIATVRLVRDAEEVIAQLEEQDDALEGDEEEIELPLRYEDEATMRALLERVAGAIDEGGQSFVADVGEDRFLVELAPGKATIRKLLLASNHELFARLRNGDFADVPEPPPQPGETREQALYWPDDMLQEMREQASRLDRSLSNVAQRAWKLASPAIAVASYEALAEEIKRYGGDKRKQTLFFPGAFLADMKAQATRLDASISFVMQAAWAIAARELAALPPAV